MSTIIRAIGFTNNVQELVMPEGFSGDVTAYLWGGGGGGGGYDSRRGGNGCGAMCSVHSFSVVPGDVIEVAVGQGGQRGGTGAGQSSQPGIPGSAYTLDVEVFNTLDLVSLPVPGMYKVGVSPLWPTFLNTYGIWYYSLPNTPVTNFDYTVNVSFPTTNYYTFTGTANQSMTVKIGDDLILSTSNFKTVYDARAPIPAGTYPVRIQATTTGANVGVVALQITNNAGGLDSSLSYSGGYGGTAGPNGSSGAGGGGGGATLLFKNSTLIAAAGGGGGGGGGGNSANPLEGQDAPGTRGQEPNTTAGQNGTNKDGDGGGGGGGGGGIPSGNGGITNAGDSGAGAGMYGGSTGSLTYFPNGLNPGGTSFAEYNGQGGRGGVYATSGSNGYAVLKFEPESVQVNVLGNWTPVQKTYIKVNDEWKATRATFVKNNGVWTPLIGTSDDYAPNPTAVFGNYGINPRPGVGGPPGGGGGGCCVVSTAFAEQGIWDQWQKDELIAWCEDRLHNRVLGECFRRGYQVVGSRALPILKTSWGKKYAKWAFDNGTRMVRGKSFAWWSVPNSLLWISAFMLVGSVVTTQYANRCWKDASHKGQ